MSTQISIIYADPFVPFFKTAETIQVFAWATLNGEIVAGSQTDPVPVVVDQASATVVQCMANTIKSALDSLTGDVGDATYNPLGSFLDDTTYGIGYMPYDNTLKNRPFVAVACQGTYTWGDLNIPVRNVQNSVFLWNFSFTASASTASSMSPAWNAVNDYLQTTGNSPVLMVLELDPA